MNSFKLLTTLIMISLIAGSILSYAVTPNDEKNQASLGTAALGVTLTSAGDLVPNVSGAVDLGNSTYPFGALVISGNATIGGALALTGAMTMASAVATGNVSASQFTLLNTVDITVTSPTAKGQIVMDTSYNVMVSTGVGKLIYWIEIGSQ